MFKVPKITSFQYLLRYLKKDIKDEVAFLLADKHQRGMVKDANINISINNININGQYIRKEVKASMNAKNCFTYIHSKQLWSGVEAHV